MKKFIVAIIAAAVVFLSVSSKNEKNYIVRKGSCYRIYYEKQDEEYVNTVALILSTYIPLMLNDYSMDKFSVEVIIYPSAEAMKKNFKKNNIKNPTGIYFDNKIHIISPGYFEGTDSQKKESFWKNGPLIHEISHCMTYRKTDGKCPIWLDEGIAMYYEYKYTGFECRERGDVITIDDLKYNFRNTDDAAAYRKSFEIVKKMMQDGNEKEFLEKIKNAKN